MKDYLVRDWMTPNPVTCPSDTPLPEAHRLMLERRIRRLPVVDDGELVGILTLGDARGAQASEATSLSVFELNYLLDKLPVRHVMHKPVITVAPEATSANAARLMLEHKIAGLPVVEAGRVIGILTESDIFRLMAESWQAREERVVA